eukprot:6058204-Pleurochrysis_carterae.AAC.1
MQTAARPRAVNSRRWIWDANLSIPNPWCWLSGFRYSGIAAFLTARRGYFDTMSNMQITEYLYWGRPNRSGNQKDVWRYTGEKS